MAGYDGKVNRRRARGEQRRSDQHTGCVAARGKRNDRKRHRRHGQSARELKPSRTVDNNGRPEQRCSDCGERCNEANTRARRMMRRARLEPSYGMFGHSAGFGWSIRIAAFDVPGGSA